MVGLEGRPKGISSVLIRPGITEGPGEVSCYDSGMDESSRTSEDLVLQSVARIISESGLAATHDQKTGCLAVSPELGDGREQIVYIGRSVALDSVAGSDVVTIFSPCAALSNAMMQDAEFLLDLLIANGTAGFGRFSVIDTRTDERLLVVMCDQMVETMETEEIHAAIQSVARAADEFEQRRARDDY